MKWSDVGAMVKAVAPTLGGILLGPPGVAAGAAVSLLADALGADGATVTPEAISQKLGNNPELLVKVQELEVAKQAQLVALQIEQLRTDLENVKSAREHEVQLAGLGHASSYGPLIISAVITVGFFITLALVLFGKIPAGQETTMNLLLGGLLAGFTQVNNYYLGSSSGSARKTALLAMAPSVAAKE